MHTNLVLLKKRHIIVILIENHHCSNEYLTVEERNFKITSAK